MSAKLKLYCGKLKQRATHSSAPSQRGASVPGRKVIHGSLWMKKGKKPKMTKVHVVVFCGTREPEISARIEITEESARSSPKPRVIHLVDLKPGVGVASTPPFLSCPSPSRHSHRGISFLSKSESEKKYFPVQLVLQSGEVVELLHTSEESQKQWVQRLNLLLMFPHSLIPDEPMVNSAMMHLFHAQVNPSEFKADSVWGVYVFPEEVGIRTHTLGLNFLALLSKISEDQKGRIDIVSPMEMHPRLVSWNREFVRRVGHLGNLSFIEIGRRCTGGPGLLWLYAGPDKAESLRLTLHQFLYDGNARCVCTGGSNDWPAICDDESSPAVPPNPTNALGQRDHKPDGMSSSQDNLLLHTDILTDSKHPSPAVSWKGEDETADRQRWLMERWMQSGVNLGKACDDHCPEDH